MEDNIFKLIEPHEILPDQVKQKTMDSLKTVQLILEIVDLFVMKSSLTVVKSFNLDEAESAKDAETTTTPNPE